MMAASPEFVSIGGNRHPAAADWDCDGSGFLAFGADNCVALWDPLVSPNYFIPALPLPSN
jgi:elongator complex protein 2